MTHGAGTPDPFGETIARLYAVIESRRGADPETSYVARLFAKGTPHLAKKLGEEAIEAALAGSVRDREETIKESADVLFHLMVLWADLGLRPADVAAELARREGVSGVTEKAKRKIL